MYAPLGRGVLSATCTAGPNAPWVFSVSLGATLDSAETPFAKNPLFFVPEKRATPPST